MRGGRWWIWLGVLVVVGVILRGVLGLIGYRPPHFLGRDGVAVIRLEGEILDIKDLLEAIHLATTDDQVRAVVLRVNSPGGTVGASQELFFALRALRAKKPLVASFGTVAASGGYYAGMAASPIFALPGTITASIGVRMMHVDASGLIQWALVRPQTLKSGGMKDTGDPIRPLRDDERAYLENLLHVMHEQFIRHVTEAREQPEAEIRAVADGRVLTGADAMAAHLVDRIGTLYDAVAEAGRQAGLDGEPEIMEYERGGRWTDRLEFVGVSALQTAVRSAWAVLAQSTATPMVVEPMGKGTL